MIGRDGAVINLAIAVGSIMRQELLSRGRPVPEPTTVRALIDTGAVLTAIHPRIREQTGRRDAGAVHIRRPSTGTGYRLAPLFEVQVAIGGLTASSHWLPTGAVGVAPSNPATLTLIGRALLKRCTFFHNGPRDELILSLRQGERSTPIGAADRLSTTPARAHPDSARLRG